MITILHRFYMYIHFYLFTLQKITEQKHEYALRLRNGIYFTGSCDATTYGKFSGFLFRLSAQSYFCGAMDFLVMDVV